MSEVREKYGWLARLFAALVLAFFQVLESGFQAVFSVLQWTASQV